MTKPKDFLREAKALSSGPATDMRRRTIVNRAYYAAYHYVMLHPCVKGFAAFRKNANMGSHTALIEFLSQSQDSTIQYVSGLLRTLFNRRRKADYVLAASISQSEAEDSVESAEELIEGVLAEWEAPKKEDKAS